MHTQSKPLCSCVPLKSYKDCSHDVCGTVAIAARRSPPQPACLLSHRCRGVATAMAPMPIQFRAAAVGAAATAASIAPPPPWLATNHDVCGTVAIAAQRSPPPPAPSLSHRCGGATTSAAPMPSHQRRQWCSAIAIAPRAQECSALCSGCATPH